MENIGRKRNHDGGNCISPPSRSMSESLTYPNTFSYKIEKFKVAFPQLSSFSIDLDNLTAAAWKLSRDSIAELFFPMLTNYENFLRGEVVKLQEKPKTAHHFSSFLLNQIREIQLFGKLYDLSTGTYEQRFQCSLVTILKHFVNTSLISELKNETASAAEELAVQIYQFIKSVFTIFEEGPGEGLLNTFLLSSLSEPGWKNKDVYECLLMLILGDLRPPYYLINKATSMIKFLVLLRIYISENENCTNDMEQADSEMGRLYRKNMRILRGVNIEQFNDIDSAKRFYKGLGTVDIPTVYRKVKPTRVIGILEKLIASEFRAETIEVVQNEESPFVSEFYLDLMPAITLDEPIFIQYGSDEEDEDEPNSSDKDEDEPNSSDKDEDEPNSSDEDKDAPNSSDEDEDEEFEFLNPTFNGYENQVTSETPITSETAVTSETSNITFSVILNVDKNKAEAVSGGTAFEETEDDDIAICGVVEACEDEAKTVGPGERDEAEADPVENAEMEDLVRKIRYRRFSNQPLLSSGSDSESDDDNEVESPSPARFSLLDLQ